MEEVFEQMRTGSRGNTAMLVEQFQISRHTADPAFEQEAALDDLLRSSPS